MIVVEIQKNDSVAIIAEVVPDRSVAEQKYHTILSAAAVSPVQVHSAVMLDDDGSFVKREVYSRE